MYRYSLPKSPSFTGTGLEGYAFGPLCQKDVDVYYIESEKGHDTFMVSRRVTRTYYVLAGNGHFTIENHRYDVCPGVLVEVPPGVEYSYSGKMTLIAFARPRGVFGNDTHTKWNAEVTCRDSGSLPGRESWTTRLIRLRILGKSPTGAFLRLNRWIWRRLPSRISCLGPIRFVGASTHALARIYGARSQAFSTYFLRNRPELELIRRLVELKGDRETLRVAVLGCSMGAEAYSIAWRIRSARPDLKLILTAVDISRHAVGFASRGVYSLTSSEPSGSTICERMSMAEKEEFFDTDGGEAKVKAWIKEVIRWRAGDVGEPDVIHDLGPQDIVVANNFLCHMPPSEAERCLRNIARLVTPGGYLFVSGIDLDVRTKVARDLRWSPVQDLLEEIHEGDPVLRTHWPWHYGGLEPLNKKRQDWTIRYAAAFQIAPEDSSAPRVQENELCVGKRRQTDKQWSTHSFTQGRTRG